MPQSFSRFLLALCAVLACLAFLAPIETTSDEPSMTVVAEAQLGNDLDYQDDGTGDSGGSCDYCTQSLCGCAMPPGGCSLLAECSCGGGKCEVSCSYTCS